MKERNRKWTYEAIKLEAARFKSCSEWCKGSRSSYNAAGNMGVIRQISQELGRVGRARPITKQEVIARALKCDNASDFHKKYPSHYMNASRNGYAKELKYKE